MAAYISHVTVDCRNAYELSEWWKQVLGYVEDPSEPNRPGQEDCFIVDPGGRRPSVLFLEVPEEKRDKNRLHFDLRPDDGTRDAELTRLLDLGAVQVADMRGYVGPGTGWVVLADPEGNEFCILRSEAEVSQTPTPAGPEPAPASVAD